MKIGKLHITWAKPPAPGQARTISGRVLTTEELEAYLAEMYKGQSRKAGQIAAY